MLSIVGIGGAGCAIVESFYRKDILKSMVSKLSLKSGGVEAVRGVAIDTSECIKDLKNIPIHNRVLIGTSRAKGHGAGGDVSLGERIIIEESVLAMNAIRKANFEKPDFFFLAAGLGGGTGTGGIAYLADRIRKTYKVPVIGILTLPARTEGTLYVNNAHHNLERILKALDGTFFFDNDAIIDRGEDIVAARKAIDKAVFRVLSIMDPREMLNLVQGKEATFGYMRTRPEHIALKDIIDRIMRDHLYFHVDMQTIDGLHLMVHGNQKIIYGQSFAKEWVKKNFKTDMEFVFKDDPGAKYLNIVLTIVGLKDIGDEVTVDENDNKKTEFDDLLGDIDSII